MREERAEIILKPPGSKCIVQDLPKDHILMTCHLAAKREMFKRNCHPVDDLSQGSNAGGDRIDLLCVLSTGYAQRRLSVSLFAGF
jgi:hypothetical protein